MTKFVFAATDPDHGRELWITDGTAAGTHLLKDIDPTTTSTGILDPGIPNSSNPTDFTRLGDGHVLFIADDATGQGLWESDGTEAGTQLVRHFDSIPTATGPGYTSLALSKNGEEVLFQAYDPVHGFELWESDGTPTGISVDPSKSHHDGTAFGTNLVGDLAVGARSSAPTGFQNIGNYSFLFATSSDASSRTYVSDGTISGTHPIPDLHFALQNNHFDQSSALLANARLVFAAASGDFSAPALYVSDGLTANTREISAVQPDSDFRSLANGQAVFGGFDSSSGNELWITDGTSDGTHLVKDITPGPAVTDLHAPGGIAGSSNPANFHLLSPGVALFTASSTDGAASHSTLWITDGTAEGTHQVADIHPGDDADPVVHFYSMEDGRVLFYGNADPSDPSAHVDAGLYITDGTSAGTVKISDVKDARSFATLDDGRVMFSGDTDATGDELWVTDGTSDGTQLLKDIDPTLLTGTTFGSSGAPQGMVAVGDFDKTAAQYVQEFTAHRRAEEPNAGDLKIAQDALSDVIAQRETSALNSSKNLALRDAEYWLRGYVGGTENALALKAAGQGFSLVPNFVDGAIVGFDVVATDVHPLADSTNRFDINDIANRYSPIATPLYNALKIYFPGLGTKINDSGLPGTTPGGYTANLTGWMLGYNDVSLKAAANAFSFATPAYAVTQSPALDALHPVKALHDEIAINAAVVTSGAGATADILAGAAKAAIFDVGGLVKNVFSYFDPVPAHDYGFAVSGNNTITGVLIPTSVTTSPVTITIDGHEPFTVTPGVAFDLTTLEPNGVSTIKISGDFGSGTPSFGFTFSQENTDTLVVEVQQTVAGEIVNSAPIAVDGTASGHGTVTGNVVGGDVGHTAEQLLYSLAGDNGGAAHGHVTLHADGSFTYAANAGYVGTDTFAFTANDGSRDSDVATEHLTIDATVAVPSTPTIALTADTGSSASDNVTGNPALTFSTPAPGDTLLYKIDAGAFSATAPSFATNGSADGVHTVSVEEMDGAGNISTAASLTFTLDTTAPGAPTLSLVHDTGVSGDKTTSDPALTFSTPAAGDPLLYKIDAGTFSTIAPSFATNGSADGLHTVSVEETDAAGNSSTAASLTFTLDTTAPDTTLTAAPADHATSTSATFNFAGSDSGSGLAQFRFILDAGTPIQTTQDSAHFDGLLVGAHTLSVAAIDVAGNVDASAATFHWTIDSAGAAPIDPAYLAPPHLADFHLT